MKQAELCMDKMENMGRDDCRVNRDGTVANKNMGKWWNNSRNARVGVLDTWG